MFATPDEAEHAFYEAIRRGDLSRMMLVWADDDEIVCIHPGGARVIGQDAVKTTWQQIFSNGPIAIYPARPLVLGGIASSIHILIEQIAIRTPYGTETTNCYTTNIFLRGPVGWCMVLHHASNAPNDAGLFDLQDIPDILH
jgi:hypothetical protein